MATPTASPSPQPLAALTIENAAKIAALALPVIYILGFMVVTIHQAEFGIVEYSLIRMKVLAAGLVFSVFVAVPAIAGLRSFRLFGMRSQGGTRVDLADDSQRIYLYIIKLLDLYPLCFFLSMLLGFLFVPRLENWLTFVPTYTQPGRWLDVAIAAETLLTFGLTFTQYLPVARQFAKKPIQCTVLAWLIWILWVVWTLKMSNWLFFQLSMWLYGVMVCCVLAATAISEGLGFRKQDWEISILVALFVFLPWFGTSMYGNLKPGFGGGYPVSAKFYLHADNPVWGRKIIKTSIIEETDQGYYVTRPSEDKNAVFIPRSSVISIQLGKY